MTLIEKYRALLGAMSIRTARTPILPYGAHLNLIPTDRHKYEPSVFVYTI